MNDSEVIALGRNCVERGGTFSCAECPYHAYARGYCEKRLMKDVLGVIERLQKQSERGS